MSDPLRLGLHAVQSVLLASNGVAPTEASEKAFRSRLGHLQRSGFPASAKVGRFARASYGLDDLLQLSFVFALVQAYVPPVVGRRVVADFWPEIARLLLAALDDVGFVGLGHVPFDAPLVMTILPRALDDLGSEERGHGRGGVDQGGFGVRLHRGDSGDGDGGPSKQALDPAGEVAATISIDFRVLAAGLVDALGDTRREALEASAADLAARFGWSR